MIETKFKETELGLIPVDWEMGNFIDFLKTFSSGATPYRGNPSNFIGNIPWITSGELNYNRITDTIEHISSEGQQKTHLTLHPKGTFLIAITGLEAAGTRGRCAFIETPATTNQSCLAINSSEKMNVEYLFWFYRLWSDYLAFNFSQGSKQQSFTAEIAKKLPIYCPPISEQNQITEALTDIDALIVEIGELIEKKRSVMTATMQDLLTARRRLPGFSEPWVRQNLGILCDIGVIRLYRGKVISKIDILNNPGPYPVYSSSVQNEGYMGSYGKYMFDEELISWSVDGGGDFFYRPPHKFSLTNVSGYMKIDESLFSFRFLAYALTFEHSKKHFDYVSKAHPSVIKREYSISYPNIEEQQYIANVLSDMDADIAELEAKRDKYVAIRQGMMQQLLTGKIRLI